MSTQTFYVSGKAKWARVYESQMDTEYGEKFHINVYPDAPSLITLKASGSRLQAKTDEDGTYYKFSRDNKKEFKGEVKTLGPPKVLEHVDGKDIPFDKIIGNGSTVTIKIDVYDSAKGKGTRLEAVRVDNHVPYEAPDGENVGEYKF